MNLLVSPWREALLTVNIESYVDLFSAFDRLSKSRKEAGSEEDYHTLKLLAELCSMHIKTESLAEPFGPRLSGPGGGERTFIPDDLTDEDLSGLEQFLSGVDNHWLRARIADTLWVRIRRKELALVAMESYLFLSDTTIRFNHEAMQLRRRALLIARAFDSAVWETSIRGLVVKFLGDNVDTIVDKLDLYRLFSGYLGVIDNKNEVLEALIVLGNKSASDGNPIIAREFWGMARDQYRGQNERDIENILTHKIADSFLEEARAQDPEQGIVMVSDRYIRAALAEYTELPRAYRQEHNIEYHIADLRKELGKIGIEVVKSMGSISSGPFDISELVRTTEARIQGATVSDALYEYARICYRTNIDATRDLAKDLVKNHPMLHLFGGVTFSSDGRVVAQNNPLDPSDSESYRRTVEAETVRQFGTTLGISAAGCIIPGLEVLQCEHHISLDQCRRMATQTVLIPADRTEAWAKGLYHGLHGSLLEAVHILVPQVEYWLRWLLQAEGIDTIVREKDGTDKQMSLEALLAHPEMRAMLSEGLWFEMNYYFLSPHGANLRNGLLHGLLPDTEVNVSLLYSMWHMCLRLIILNLPIRRQLDV